MASILVVLEQRNGALRKGAADALAAARRLAAAGDTVDALVAADKPVAGLDALGAAGADRVLVATDACFAHYNPDGLVAVVRSVSATYRAVVLAPV